MSLRVRNLTKQNTNIHHGCAVQYNIIRVFSVCVTPCVLQKEYDNALVLFFCVSSGKAQFHRHRVKRNFLLTFTRENAPSTFSLRDPVPPYDDYNFRYSMPTYNCNQHEVLRWNLSVLWDMPTNSFRDFSQSLQKNTGTLNIHVSRLSDPHFKHPLPICFIFFIYFTFH